MIMKAITYLRRSKKADDNTVSLKVQRESCQRYALHAHLELAEEVIDDGVSGTDRARFTRLAELVLLGDYKNIVVYSIDRLARDVSGLLDELERYEKAGVTIHCATQNKSISIIKAHDFLAVGVEALVAQHYSKLISEKTRDAHARLKQEGKRQSRYAPVGFKLAEGGILEPDRSTLRRIEEAKILRKQGLTLRAIDIAMRAAGLKLAVSTWGKLLHE